MNECNHCNNKYAPENEKKQPEINHQDTLPQQSCTNCEGLKEKLSLAEKQILYLRSDLENIRRNSLREVQMKVERQTVSVVLEFLHVCDDLRRCLDAAQDQPASPIKEGLLLVDKTMLKIFDQLKIEMISGNGTVFDPEEHEALSYIAASEQHPEGSIISTVRPGYKLNNKVIRPAQVIVAS